MLCVRNEEQSGFCSMCESPPYYTTFPRSGGLRTQKLKSNLMRNTELKGSPFKAWSWAVYSHACYAYSRDFFLTYFYPSSPFTCIFSNLSRYFLCWLWLTHGSCVGPQNKIGHPVGGIFPCWVPAEYKQAQKTWRGMITCEMNNFEREWSLCSALM